MHRCSVGAERLRQGAQWHADRLCGDGWRRPSPVHEDPYQPVPLNHAATEGMPEPVVVSSRAEKRRGPKKKNLLGTAPDFEPVDPTVEGPQTLCLHLKEAVKLHSPALNSPHKKIPYTNVVSWMLLLRDPSMFLLDLVLPFGRGQWEAGRASLHPRAPFRFIVDVCRTKRLTSNGSGCRGGAWHATVSPLGGIGALHFIGLPHFFAVQIRSVGSS